MKRPKPTMCQSDSQYFPSYQLSLWHPPPPSIFSTEDIHLYKCATDMQSHKENNVLKVLCSSVYVVLALSGEVNYAFIVNYFQLSNAAVAQQICFQQILDNRSVAQIHKPHLALTAQFNT